MEKEIRARKKYYSTTVNSIFISNSSSNQYDGQDNVLQLQYFLKYLNMYLLKIPLIIVELKQSFQKKDSKRVVWFLCEKKGKPR